MISSWLTSSLEWAMRKGYIGVLDTHIRLKDNITRDESVVTLQMVK